jgi:hypothetical protein
VFFEIHLLFSLSSQYLVFYFRLTSEMSAFIQPSHPNNLDDEIAALTLQLKEIKYLNETSKKGKYPVDKIPDLEVAYANYLAEIETHLGFLKDVKLAHSIANAVDTDARLIAEMSQQEAQAQDDRRYARQISTDHPLEYEAPPPYTEEIRKDFIEDEIVRRLAAIMTTDDSTYEEVAVEAGPSVPYAQRQAKALGQLSREQFECCACRDDFRLASVTKLECGHIYCSECLKRVIMRATVEKDLVYMPPRCCGTPIIRSLVVSSLTTQELEDFENTEIEKDTREKTYCSNHDCGRFIASRHIKASEATCPRCKHKTCIMCKNHYHKDDCPADSDLQTTLELGQAQHWQRCFSCRALVEIDWGCNHMT